MDNLSKNKVSSAISMMALLTVSGILFFQVRNNKLEIAKEKEIQHELESQNSNLKRELKVLQEDYNNNSVHYNDIINEKENQIRDNNKKINYLTAENKSSKNARLKIKDYEAQNTALMHEIEILKGENYGISRSIKDHSDKIASLEMENSQLREKNRFLLSSLTDNSIITAVKGKRSKLTAIAAKSSLIKLQMEIPAEISTAVNYEVVYPDGRIVQSSSSINLSDISSESIVNTGQGAKLLEIAYKPAEKLKRGIYKINVLNGNHYISGVSIGLK